MDSSAIDRWDIPDGDKRALKEHKIPPITGLWISCRIQEDASPRLRFEGVRPLYEVCRTVSRDNPDTAYSCFGAEQGTGRVFMAHTVKPEPCVNTGTKFHPCRLVNSTVRTFADCLELAGKEYEELFGATSAEDVVDDTENYDDESLWAIYSKYLELIRDTDPKAFSEPNNYWRHTYWMTWQEFGFPPLRNGRQPF
ncbi:hypothetical protein GCM10019016_027360 [Streptomyces prasinosporus]|uniref:Uncharacterized protein n=1 Tax=Streptomyces prasinosporus TaxID=68256 RepID=A0ABP6TK82_9ACTN